MAYFFRVLTLSLMIYFYFFYFKYFTLTSIIIFILLVSSVPFLIETAWLPLNRNKKRIQRNVKISKGSGKSSGSPPKGKKSHIIDSMTGEEFEDYLAEMLIKDPGIKEIRRTKTVGDFGADLIIITPDGQRAIAQVKRYSKPVGIKAIQEVTAAMNHYKAQRAIVITNNYFTLSADELATSNNIELFDRDRLFKWLSRLG